MSSRPKIFEFLGLKRGVLALLGMVILVGMGEKMAERFLPIYILALGGGAMAVGLLNGLDNLLSALYSFPGGYLSDRLGYKRALLVFNLVAMTGYLVVILVPHWIAVILGSVLFLSWSAISLPASMDLISRVLPPAKRTMGVSMHSLVRRIPMALGPVVGGSLIQLYGTMTGIRLAFGVALLMGAISLVMQQALLEGAKERRTAGEAERNPFRLLGLMSPSFRNLLVSDILIRFCEQIPYAFVVVWCLQEAGVTPIQFGILTTVEMVTAMLVYVPVAYLADRGTKKPFVVITFGFFTLFPLALLFSRSFGVLLIVFILRGLKEFGEPTRKALILDLAPERKKAGMFGAYYLARDVVVSLAAFGGAFLWSLSPAVNLLAAFGFGVVGTLCFALYGKDLSSDPNTR
ncbi:MAG: MFS transporter [Deltaproteobacteria bacterium]|nr:MFS transporter [Deltaproteobacteria bacterium]